MFLPWIDKKNTTQYNGKKVVPIHVMQGEDKKHEEIIKETVHTEPPHDENTPCINLNEGICVIMWDKRKGKPKYHEKENNSWLGPYITRKKLL
jgi:hypothetical protein